MDPRDKDIISFINKLNKKAQIAIMEIIIKDYKIDKTAAKKIYDNINSSTRTVMIQKYKHTIYHNPRDKDAIQMQYPDLDGWTNCVDSVPKYQSLGDTIGYYNGKWEFNYNMEKVGPESVNDFIYEFISLGGINDISINNWMATDDTILYFATLRVLLRHKRSRSNSIDDYGTMLREEYIKVMPLMENRDPGTTTMNALNIQKNIKWNKLPYNSNDISAGSAMRSGCIGMLYPGSFNRQTLIWLAVETSRITHNSATAILGSITAALFTAYALEKTPVSSWPHKLLKFLRSDKIDEYMKSSRPQEYKLYVRDKVLFIGQWDTYVNKRFSGSTVRTDLKFMKNPVLRYKYLAENFSKANPTFPGSLADDCVIMAYDALLESGDTLEKLIVYAILHPGDSDTVGSVAMSWFGAIYHSSKNAHLTKHKFDKLEFYDDIVAFTNDCYVYNIETYFFDLYLHFANKYLKQLNIESETEIKYVKINK